MLQTSSIILVFPETKDKKFNGMQMNADVQDAINSGPWGHGPWAQGFITNLFRFKPNG